jgi:hypothetical protein
MNTKAVISAIEYAMERTVNYPSLIEKIAYLDGLAAACEYPHPGHPMMTLEVQWKRINKAREVLQIQEKKEARLCEADRVRLLTTFPNTDYQDDPDEESVFDVVPEELQEEVKAMDAGLDLAPNNVVVVPNPLNTVLDMAREILVPGELQQSIDRTQRDQSKPIIYEPTAEALEQIMQDKIAATLGLKDFILIKHIEPNP